MLHVRTYSNECFCFCFFYTRIASPLLSPPLLFRILSFSGKASSLVSGPCSDS
jgi:hypothetical protein